MYTIHLHAGQEILFLDAAILYMLDFLIYTLLPLTKLLFSLACMVALSYPK